MTWREESVGLASFREGLKGFGELEVERHEGAVYGLLPDLTLAFLNPAWFRFAWENGGQEKIERWGLGANVLGAISGPAREFYEEGFSTCLVERKPWRLEYECSSAKRFRQFHMDVIPLADDRGLLVINTLFVEHPHAKSRAVMEPLEELYTNFNGLIIQCGFCRRVERALSPGRWDWIPAWLEDEPRNVSSGICNPCAQTMQNYLPPVE